MLEIILFVLLVNLFVLLICGLTLIYIAAFLVNFREQQKEFFSDILELTVEEPESILKQEPKTWDEKYEMELMEFQKRLREANDLSSGSS